MMSRVEKFGSSRGKGHQEQAAGLAPRNATDTNAEALPPRRKKHPSNVQKVTKWYYNALFLLFVCLVAGLFWYGIRFTD
ncbi:hypothetical protein [Paenibacillus lupini]|uniref:hypothetical protein n=1 Tax=Paenibacillus lupini TaxID=1450204 RepID=UPI001420A329|nr:hypothetical protein [Paenibacillus lupini]NIK21081.1 hypothetical protein [Paenibacillus lupini]